MYLPIRIWPQLFILYNVNDKQEFILTRINCLLCYKLVQLYFVNITHLYTHHTMQNHHIIHFSIKQQAGDKSSVLLLTTLDEYTQYLYRRVVSDPITKAGENYGK